MPSNCPAPNVFEILALRAGRRSFIQVDRDAKTPGDLSAHVFRHRHAVFDRDAVDRNERNHIGSTHPRVCAFVLREVDQLGGPADAANGGFLNRFAVANQRDHAAIVVGIHLAIEEIDTGHLHGFDDGVDFGLVTAFGKIGNAFNECVWHGRKDKSEADAEVIQFRDSYARG